MARLGRLLALTGIGVFFVVLLAGSVLLMAAAFVLILFGVAGG